MVRYILKGGINNVYKLKSISQKKGIPLGQAFGAVLTLVLVAVLVIISLILFNSLGTSIAGGVNNSAFNATQVMITQFGTYPALIGLVGTIIFLGIVIGVLVASFAFGGRKGGA